MNGAKTGYLTIPGNSAGYAPHGGILQKSYGNGLITNYTYNNRLQLQTLSAGSLLGISYGWGTTNNNGNLLSEMISAGSSSPFSESFGYDTVNRLISATDSGGWTQTFKHDAFGNMWESASGLKAG